MRALLYLAANESSDGPTSARQIAEACDLPEAFAASILRELVHAGALVSLRGAKGGFMLAQPAGETTWADMIEAVHGSLAWTPCVAGANRVCQHCPQSADCAVRTMAERLNRSNLTILRSVRLNQPVVAP